MSHTMKMIRGTDDAIDRSNDLADEVLGVLHGCELNFGMGVLAIAYTKMAFLVLPEQRDAFIDDVLECVRKNAEVNGAIKPRVLS